MFGEKPTCSTCHKEIKGNDVVYVKMRYPSYKGMTEIKAYLNNEGTFICESCFLQNEGTIKPAYSRE
ncbi:Fe3+ hydroxamate ABC transporter substrate-binding protein [Bacillus sp. RAR_GA_16]|uniref:Fe3+ hydroxamate ABC transporter substrate-binding protein n=1 Tax=Bacillus sp. RAR_GA_16 TaxID=2876774 RepID=UPI001CCDF97F|nr:Fe3+ hydroxamate ABC transporter substrate-binding protein [Bacillus sp. RAR_GA_16]MCA0171213.1 Fe3+ hydroxamate ABC transporter substrate-binding protein [Bacillus sp. RAR_GA_16]